jgi:hypothetical protein
LSLSLISVVVSSAGLVLFAGIDGWIKNDARAEMQQNLRIAINVLVREIRRADTIHVYDERLIMEYRDGSVNSYYYEPRLKEIRLGGSNSTIAMYIEGCGFGYDRGLVSVAIAAAHPSVPGERSYSFSIYPRGKAIYVY